MKNIWENFDFENKELEDKNKQAFAWFINILKEEIENAVGEFPDLNIVINTGKDGWFYTKFSIGIVSRAAFDVNLDKNNKLILFQPFSNMDLYRDKPIKTLSFEPELIFRDYVKQLIVSDLIPAINEWYKFKFINLPEKMKGSEKKIDLSKITKEWFKNVFDQVTEEQMNGETAKKIKIEQIGKELTINFDIDCDRYGYWKNHTVTINDRGNVSINLSDCPVEGAIESTLKRKLDEILKQK